MGTLYVEKSLTGARDILLFAENGSITTLRGVIIKDEIEGSIVEFQNNLVPFNIRGKHEIPCDGYIMLNGKRARLDLVPATGLGGNLDVISIRRGVIIKI